MELPPLSAKLDHKIRYGAYVGSRLRLLKLEPQAELVERKTTRLRELRQRLDDASARVQEQMAARDHWVEAFGNKVRELYAKLDGNPALRAASMRIFRKGLDPFVAAPLGELENKINEFIGLLEKHLANQPEMQKKMIKAVKNRLKGFKESTRLMSEARAALFEARTKREKANKGWESSMRKVHEEVAAAKDEETAERIFPKASRVAALDGDDRGGKMGELRSALDSARLQSIVGRPKG